MFPSLQEGPFYGVRGSGLGARVDGWARYKSFVNASTPTCRHPRKQTLF